MKLQELKSSIEEYQYMEDTDVIEVALASIIATRLMLGDPVWMIIIGASSGGKSQILRPLAMTDDKFLHRIDDLTENTLLSGGITTGGGDISLLTKIGTQGMLVISDMTVIFSKAKESRNAILSQFRMIYDGEMKKYVGNKKEALHWKGFLGILAGSTPSIYAHFEEVADMGERFIYYRMKSYDAEKATTLSMKRTIYGKDLDQKLSDLYIDYLKEVVVGANIIDLQIPEFAQERIISVAMLAEKIRTPIHVDFKDREIDRIPVPAMPMRVALQLTALVKGLMIMRQAEGLELEASDMNMIDWCAYSLANEEKRACLKLLSIIPFDATAQTQVVADAIGLSTGIVRMILQNLASVGVVKRNGGIDGALTWKIQHERDWKLIREIEGIEKEEILEEREITVEELQEIKQDLNLDDIF